MRTGDVVGGWHRGAPRPLPPAMTTRDESSPMTGEFEPFRIDVEPSRDSVRVAPWASSTSRPSRSCRTEVDGLRESGFTKLVLDLRGVRFLDSTGLRLILELDARPARPRRSWC